MNEKEQKLADKFLDAAIAADLSTEADTGDISRAVVLYGNLVSASEIRQRSSRPSPLTALEVKQQAS